METKATQLAAMGSIEAEREVERMTLRERMAAEADLSGLVESAVYAHALVIHAGRRNAAALAGKAVRAVRRAMGLVPRNPVSHQS